MSIYIVWPEKRWVEESQIETWYLDAVENGIIEIGQHKLDTIDEMTRALEDVGIITRGRPPE